MLLDETRDIQCPPNGLPENETCPQYPDQTNGGCDSPWTEFGLAACGDTICGTAWATDTTRDTDWYWLDLSVPQVLTWQAAADFPVWVAVIRAGSQDCLDTSIVAQHSASAGDTARAVTPCLDAGVYWMYVSPSGFGDLECMNYVAALSCSACPSGRCCFGPDPFHPECAETDEMACAALNGRWTEGLTCLDTCPTPPLNDLCTGRVAVSVPSSTAGTTENATWTNVGTCGVEVSSPDVWYSVMGTGQTITATTCNTATSYDTRLSIFCNSCSEPVCVAGNEDDDTCGLGGGRSSVSWCSEAGTEYLILVHGNGASGAFRLDLMDDGVTCSTPPICVPCQTITCPGAVAESEPNDGCAAIPHEPLESISCGQTVTGTVTAGGDTRDVDGFEITLTTVSSLTASVSAEFDVEMWLCRATAPAACPDSVLVHQNANGRCEDEVVSRCLSPGVYRIYVAPIFMWLSEPKTYCLTLACGPCTAGRCCYGADPHSPLCADTDEYECDDLGGTWTADALCESDPCPLPPACDDHAMSAQGPHLPGETWSAATSELAAGLRVYEDFVVPWWASTLTVWGLALHYDSEWSACSENPTPLHVAFFADSAGLPGAVLCDYEVMATPEVEDGLIYLDGFLLHRYEIELEPPCGQPSGWISVQGAGDAQCWFLWMSSPSGNGASWQQSGSSFVETGYDRALCLGPAPCERTDSNLTICRQAGADGRMQLQFAVSSEGNYVVFSTTVASNDGDPRYGDPQWTVEDTVGATGPGVLTWTDSAAVVPYKSYVVLFDCAIPLSLGRCCTGDPVNPTCDDSLSLYDCVLLGGTWSGGLTCDQPCPPREYCTASSATTCDPSWDEWVSRVEIADLNYPSGCVVGGYSDFTSLSTAVTRGTSYPISVINGNAFEGDTCAVWMDWNQDRDFDDTGETVVMTGGPYWFEGSVIPPIGAPAGTTRMRVRIVYSLSPIPPCGAVDFGETEDYSLIVQ